MSIAQIADRAKVTTDRMKSANILILDIERMKGRAHVEFWDLGDFKNRRLHADSVVEYPRTICVAWKWFGTKRVEFAAEWDKGGRQGMLDRAWDAYDKADVIVGHNLGAFDTKKLRGDWFEAGMPEPSPFKTVDTLRAARTAFGFESNTLDALCKRLGLVAKTDRYDVEVARAACAGDKAAQRKLASYNRGDILATEALYLRLQGFIPNHPHMGTISNNETVTCPQCGSEDLERNGLYRAVQIDYLAYRCLNCGGNVRGGHHSRAAVSRGVR